MVPAAVSVVAALSSFAAARALVAPLLLLANVAAFVVFLPAPIYVDYGAAGRAASASSSPRSYCLPALARGSKGGVRLLRGATLLWSPVWFFYIGLMLGLPIVTIAIK